MRFTRRELLEGAAVLALSFALTGPDGLAFAQSASTEELLQPGPLGDKVQGKADAPVTIVEYASMTCSHCADFHVKTYPALKSRYIDTGKVRYVFREFPLDPLAAGAAMLARCVPEDKYFAAIDVLFQQRDKWVVQKPIEPLGNIAKQFGLTQQQFEQCLSNQSLLDGLDAVRQRAAQKFGVNSTPTFFINGKIQRGSMSIEELEKLIQPLLKT